MPRVTSVVVVVAVAVMGVASAARGARAQPAWSHDPAMFRVGEAPGWEVAVDLDLKLFGEDLGGGGVEVEGADRHDQVLAHVARIGVDRISWSNDSLTSNPGDFTATRVAFTVGERACAFGVLCAELGVGGYVAHAPPMSGPIGGGGALAAGRVVIRMPLGPALVRFGFGGEAAPDQRALVAFLGVGARW